jgi:large subunit ribosomal protein L30
MKIAVVRVRGQVHVRKEITHALRLLRLEKKNHCTVIEDQTHTKGMLEMIKNYATWGPVDDPTLALLKKRGKGPLYRLNPPRKGYGRKGIKLPFVKGGALGNRGEKMTDLIKRMV